MTRKNSNKASRLIAKGDKLIEKGKFKRALKKFKKALKFDPDRAELYDRLVNAHEQATEDWAEKDVAESVLWVMKKQEIENPAIKMTHAKLEPEWKEIAQKIKLLLVCDNKEDEGKIIEMIVSYGTDSIYPLIDTIIQIREGFKNQPGEN